MIRYTIKLKETEREALFAVINKGNHSSLTYRTAYILLNCDKGDFSDDKHCTTADICNILKVGERTVERVKKKFIEEGFEGVLERRVSAVSKPKKVDGDVEAKLVALCCSEPPAGFAKWSLRLLAEKMVELQYIDYISHVSVGTVLKKMNLSLGK